MRKTIELNDVTHRIKQWVFNRHLHEGDPYVQTVKLGEEFGELCEGLVKKNNGKIYDSIGDMYITLVSLSMQLGVNIEDCINLAYEEIKDRKGEIVNGVFVKEGDL